MIDKLCSTIRSKRTLPNAFIQAQNDKEIHLIMPVMTLSLHNCHIIQRFILSSSVFSHHQKMKYMATIVCAGCEDISKFLPFNKGAHCSIILLLHHLLWRNTRENGRICGTCRE